MNRALKAGFLGALLAASAAYADVGREESLDEAVRQFAAKVEAEWQQCLKNPNTRTTHDSDLCLSVMVRASNEKVDQKYQEKMVTAQHMADHPDAFATYETVPSLLQDSQSLWKQYVKADCDGIYAESAAGTARSGYALFCKYKHALHRLRALDEWF
ncbi:lysozyme inhibitor LprI family protein [Pseudomonas putida]|uniref:lysozyme inhibitor LprI family protein n=1 Tax=Pseudomonas putida TaxID=303 RepID=UPI0005B96822|nr:lysozyme inhibitor LprI family protein [Pseudomonas putida]